ncbi:MAG: hypothetical protein E7435_01100 [Ruminococcaceae bacterium]|nr:hypothetical protein [Oscillospiraceae bacterium]
MDCKFCGKEIPEDAKTCPECGAEFEPITAVQEIENDSIAPIEEIPAVQKKKKPGLPVWAIVCIAVLTTAVVTLGVLWGITELQKATEENPFTIYTATDKEVVAARDRVVATVGDKQLTIAQLQVYYWITVYSFMDENSYYLSFLGFDYTKDLATQECYFEKGISWQEYLLKTTLSTWHQYMMLNIEAEEQDFKLNEDEQKYLDNFRKTMDEQVKQYGYADAEEMIQKELGVGATFDAYEAYNKETFVGMGYYNQFAESLKITEEDIVKYYEDNQTTFDENKIKKDDTDFAWVGVRHILLIPEATKDENGKAVYTEAAWEACRKEAQALLDSFLSGKEVTEEVFAELAKEHTEDPGSKDNGGLYEQFFRNEMVKEFEDWSFDATRKYGDTGLVKTSYGYHIMYFIEGEAQWHYYADAQLRSDACQKLLDDLKAKYPLDADYNKILLGHVALG